MSKQHISNNMMTYQFQGRTASMAGSDRRCTSSIQKSKRRVTFKPTITVQPIKNIAMQSEDKSRLYYSKDELKTLSLEIKAYIPYPRSCPRLSHAGYTPHGKVA